MDNELIVGVAAAVSSRVQEFLSDYHRRRLVDLEGGGMAKTKAAVADVVMSDTFAKSMRLVVENWAAGAIEKKTGVVLEHGINEESLARALGKRAGFVLRSLHDRQIIEADLLTAAAERMAARMGWGPGEKIETAEDLRRLLERRAAKEIEARVVGLVLHDLMDQVQTAQDFAVWVTGRIRARSGIPLRDVMDMDKTRADLVAWAEPEVRRRLGVSGSSLAGGLKMTKKAIRNRNAQRRFYEARGNRNVYQSIK